jgi:hypothetical protein
MPIRSTAGETIIDIDPEGRDEEIDRASLRSVAPPVPSLADAIARPAAGARRDGAVDLPHPRIRGSSSIHRRRLLALWKAPADRPSMRA